MSETRGNTTRRTVGLTKEEILGRAYAIALCSPAYPPAPDKFFDRPALTYRSPIRSAISLCPMAK
jgi:acetoacetate decarboxylase